MGYTNETTHYGIPLPLGTDKTTPMDYNESMQEVDTVLFGAKSDSDSALRKAQQVEESLSQTDDSLTTLTDRVTTLEGTSITHGNAIQQNAQDIADVRADALDMIEAKDEGTAQVATVAVSKGEYFRYNNVLYIATQNIAVGATIVPNTNCRATNVGAELKQLNSDLDSVDTLAGSAKTRADEAYDAATNGDTIVATWINALSNINGKFARIGYVHHLQFSARIAGGIGAGSSNIGQIAEAGNYPSVHVIAPITTSTGYCGSIQIGTNGAISIEFPQAIPDCYIVANLVY